MVKCSESRTKDHKDYRKWWAGKNQNCREKIITRSGTVLKSINFKISPKVQRNITGTTLTVFHGKLMSPKILYLNFSY